MRKSKTCKKKNHENVTIEDDDGDDDDDDDSDGNDTHFQFNSKLSKIKANQLSINVDDDLPTGVGSTYFNFKLKFKTK